MVVAIIIGVLYLINAILIGFMIFFERKSSQTIMSWIVILTFFPFFGLLFYIIFGYGLNQKTRRQINKKKKYTKDYESFKQWQTQNLIKNNKKTKKIGAMKSLIDLVLNNSNAWLMHGNKVKVFTNGQSKIASLLKDINKAKKTINIEYYIFANDNVGKKVMDSLCLKARQGVKVKLIYDAVGCFKTPKRFFKKLKKSGGEVKKFFPSIFKLNYRNHRKIVVIDGSVAYLGGINIRDDHMGKNKKLSPWRDTHVSILGPAVWDLENIFFNDWRFCSKQKSSPKELIKQGYFDVQSLDKNYGDVSVQVISSGPEEQSNKIQDAFVKMIGLAKHSILIQTPYFIPDDIFFNALILAKKSGVDVSVMIPSKPDKQIVYDATLSFADKLVECGVNVFMYNGFLHSKVIIVDDKVVSIGTCNIDNRSFSLNFEVSALFYNKQFAIDNQSIFYNDIKNCKKLSQSFFKNKSIFHKIALQIFRLFSPIM